MDGTVSLITKFDGGMAEDIRTQSQDQSQDCTGFDIFSNPHLLTPYGDAIAETMVTGTMDDHRITDVFQTTFGITGIGNTSNVSSVPSFYTKTNINDPWTFNTTGTAGHTFIQGSGVYYKNKLFCLSLNGTQYNLDRFDSLGVVTSIGTFNIAATSYARPFVHPEDNVLYIVVGNVIASWDGTTFTVTTTILPLGYYCTSISNYGTYLAIVMNPTLNNANAICFLWGRDPSLNTLQGTIDLGEGLCQIVENLYNTLYFVVVNSNFPLTKINNKIRIKQYAGASVQTVYSLQVPINTSVLTYKYKFDGRLHFLSGSETAIYAFGKNSEGQFILTHDRYMNNGVTVGSGQPISMVGDVMFIASTSQGGVYSLMRSKVNGLGEQITYFNTAVFISTLNPAMGLSRYTIQGKHKVKNLMATAVLYTGANSGNTNLKYSIDSSAMTSIMGDTNATGEFGTEAGMQADGYPFNSGREFQFQMESSGGSKIKGLFYRYVEEQTLI